VIVDEYVPVLSRVLLPFGGIANPPKVTLIVADPADARDCALPVSE
jgi:hypothetical protein